MTVMKNIRIPEFEMVYICVWVCFVCLSVCPRVYIYCSDCLDLFYAIRSARGSVLRLGLYSFWIMRSEHQHRPTPWRQTCMMMKKCVMASNVRHSERWSAISTWTMHGCLVFVCNSRSSGIMNVISRVILHAPDFRISFHLQCRPICSWIPLYLKCYVNSDYCFACNSIYAPEFGMLLRMLYMPYSNN